jgi:enterochelin esterase-like enzyme
MVGERAQPAERDANHKGLRTDAGNFIPGWPDVLEPQSTFVFVLLILGFAGLMFWMVRTRRIVLRVAAAFLAFVLAVQVGILAVNKYFDYYPTWAAAVDDITNPGPAIAQVSDSSLVNSSYGKSLISTPVDRRLAIRQGFTFQVALPGRRSHISRLGLIYLPPQYFQGRYRHYRFPVIELLHGQPGVPQDWINVAGVTAMMDELMRGGLARPAVLVMPDANGGQRVSLQCLNVRNGPADLTYLGVDVPADVEAMLSGRVQPAGRAWGIAGYSEGGYCAANMALHLRRTYGYAGVLSGYFTPQDNDLLASGREVDPFASNRQRYANSPVAEVRALRPGEPVPQFWVGAGAADRQDVQNADYFVQLLALYQVVPPVHVAPGGHTMGVWRAELPAMLEWMTTNLAQAVTVLREHAIALAKHRGLPCRRPAPASSSLFASRSPGHRRARPGSRPRPPLVGCSPRPAPPPAHH